MSKRLNNIIVEDITRSSQYDGMLVLRDIHDLPGHSIRVRDALSVVPQHYTHFDATYNGNGQPTQVIYYAGTKAEITQIGVKEASSLNNKYFFLFEGRTNKSYYIWFNVDGLGVDPSVTNSTGIEISLNSSDPAILVAAAIELTLNNLYKDKWYVLRKNAVLEVSTVKRGEVNDTLDGDTTFIFSTLQQGSQQEVARVDIDYSNNGDPIYEGQVLRGHTFNIFTGKFDKNEVEVTLINEQGTPFVIYNEISSLAQNATATVLTYIVPANTLAKLKRINAFGTNMGTYVVKVNGVTIDRFSTYYTHYNESITLEELETASGDIVTIEVTNRGKGAADYNSNLQGRLLDV